MTLSLLNYASSLITIILSPVEYADEHKANFYSMTIISPKNYNNPMVTLNTSMGDIYLEVYKTKAPITANNFLSYCYQHFYDNTIFHRVIDKFMIQGGGYTVRPFEEKKVAAPIVLESKLGLHNFTGTVAMARTAEPNSATSQFFINLANNFFLDYASVKNPGYAVFANVLNGMDVAQAIAKVELFPESTQPKEDVAILSTDITMFYKNIRDKYILSHDGTNYVMGSGTSSKPLTQLDSLQFKDKKLWLSPTIGSVTGSDQHDLIFGDQEDNVITGGLGDDEINGMAGSDQLTGSAGSDRFIFSTSFSLANLDVISDFEPSTDVIMFSKNLLGSAYKSVPKTLASDLVMGPAPQASDKTDHFLYDTITGLLSYDPDGNGNAQAIPVVTLTGHPDLSANNLVIF